MGHPETQVTDRGQLRPVDWGACFPQIQHSRPLPTLPPTPRSASSAGAAWSVPCSCSGWPRRETSIA
ncbi:hypothetical protein ACFFX0_11495 [Citricoccus parietis]|uniref:Uncharacterized protein n=1 Tax=Citricoccus parietis TaxID=592307 RepID=A0ABV5FYM9_9MICC